MTKRIQFIAGYDPASPHPEMSVVTVFKPDSIRTVCQCIEVSRGHVLSYHDMVTSSKQDKSRGIATDLAEERQRLIDYYNRLK